MYPHERSLVKRLANQPFALIGVNSDRDRERLKEVLREKELTWRSFFDGGGTGGPIATRWGVTGWPTIYILDHEGVIRNIGARGEAMDRVVEDLLSKIPGRPGAEPAEEAEPKKPRRADL